MLFIVSHASHCSNTCYMSSDIILYMYLYCSLIHLSHELFEHHFCVFSMFFDEMFDIIKKGEIVGQLAC